MKKREGERECGECYELILYFYLSLYNEIYIICPKYWQAEYNDFSKFAEKIITQTTCSAFYSPCFVHYVEPHNCSFSFPIT